MLLNVIFSTILHISLNWLIFIIIYIITIKIFSYDYDVNHYKVTDLVAAVEMSILF